MDHFNEQVNSLNTALEAHRIIMIDIMYHFFNEYKVCEDKDFRDYLTEVELKFLC